MKTFYSKYERIINAIVISLVPITVCLIRALVAGRSLLDVWFCGSNWQDEAYYWQLTNDVVHYGIPQGYFGFNESSARYLSFSAWSPFLLIFWIIWGVLFGWGLLSPIICNIVIFTLAVFLFVFLAKPGLKGTLILGVLLLVLSPLSRFMLSCMAEISVISVLIVFLGLTVALYKEYRNSYLAWSMILLVIMTMMRPYLVMYALFTLLILIKYRKKIWIPAVTGVVSLVLYLTENKLFAPQYFDDYFRTGWIRTFFSDGIGPGFKNMFSEISDYGGQILSLVFPGLRYGKDGIAAYYGVFVAFTTVFVVLGILSLVKKKETCILTGSMAFLFIAMFFAIILMYKINEGYRHLLIFIVAGIFILSVTVEEITDLIAASAFFVIISWVFIYKAKDGYYYEVYFADSEGPAMVEDISRQMYENMELKEGVTWDNTVIWVSADYVEESDEYRETLWRMLYGLPAGYGLNICSAQYVNDNFDALNSGYIATVPGGTVDKLLKDSNAPVVAVNEYFVMYDIR